MRGTFTINTPRIAMSTTETKTQLVLLAGANENCYIQRLGVQFTGVDPTGAKAIVEIGYITSFGSVGGTAIAGNHYDNRRAETSLVTSAYTATNEPTYPATGTLFIGEVAPSDPFFLQDGIWVEAGTGVGVRIISASTALNFRINAVWQE